MAELVSELNRLANGGTYPPRGDYVGAAKAANTYAGTTNLDVVGALNVKAGNPRDQWKDLGGVANQLAGTFGLAPAKALSLVVVP